MTLVLLSWLLLDAGVSARDLSATELQVTVSDAGGTEDPALANALARALEDAGLRARRSPERAGAGCRDRCVRVVVRATEPRRFAVEVRSRSEVSQAALQLDPSASSFDRAHALAIQVEMLAEQVRRRRRSNVHPSVSLSSEAPPETEPPARPPTGVETPPPPEPVSSPANNPSAGGAPTVEAAPTPPQPQAEARVALNVAALMLVGTSGGLFMHGSTVGVRVVLGHRVDLRAGISFLRPENGKDRAAAYRRELLPLQLSTTLEVPHLSGLRAGGGMEAVLVSSDAGAGETPSAWSLGAIGRIEYRHAIRSFALMSSVQAALHPRSWSIGDGAPALAMPPWTLAVSLGLEFRLF